MSARSRTGLLTGLQSIRKSPSVDVAGKLIFVQFVLNSEWLAEPEDKEENLTALFFDNSILRNGPLTRREESLQQARPTGFFRSTL
jgi:hypothetical protein